MIVPDGLLCSAALGDQRHHTAYNEKVNINSSTIHITISVVFSNNMQVASAIMQIGVSFTSQ